MSKKMVALSAGVLISLIVAFVSGFRIGTVAGLLAIGLATANLLIMVFGHE